VEDIARDQHNGCQGHQAPQDSLHHAASLDVF
jgi:hypothetical protein